MGASPEFPPVSDFLLPLGVVEVGLLVKLVVDRVAVVPHELLPLPQLGMLKRVGHVFLVFRLLLFLDVLVVFGRCSDAGAIAPQSRADRECDSSRLGLRLP